MDRSMRRPLWEPRDVENTNLYQFIKYVNGKHGLGIRTYDELHQWSVGDETYADFWRDAYAWLGLAPNGSTEVGRMFDGTEPTASHLFPPPTFFPNDRLNIAEILLRDGKDDDVAIHFAREGTATVEHVTWRQLRKRVQLLRNAMISANIAPGDIVASVASNSVYSITICLAALSIGAVWSSSSPDLGFEAIVERYGQVHPKLVFADDGYMYAGKQINLQDRVARWSHILAEKTTQLNKVVILPYAGQNIRISDIYRGCTLQDFLKTGAEDSLAFTFLPFSHPAFILYSSGTTGKPKCIVHSTGGVALKVKVDMVLQHDIRKGDVVFQYTTTSWVMWVLNLLNLSSGASMLLYDGSPYHPTPTVLLNLAQDLGVSVFGTSPRYLSDLRSAGILPGKQFNLERLRLVTSTGSVLSADIYKWFYGGAFPSSVHLASMCGGTDISGCFIGGTPLKPIYAGEIQARTLGMAVDIFDPTESRGISIRSSGKPGELVCTKPFPSQPLRFHGPDGKIKYRLSYFERFGATVWCQGDFSQCVPDTGGFIMLGRSDGVLNPSGVRFGSAEIYSVTETFPEIADSICVGQRRDIDEDERVLLFVKMNKDHLFSRRLEAKLKNAIKDSFSPRHVPRFVFPIADIPYTTSGKKCEVNVKNVVSGRDIVKTGTMANPASLDLYKQFCELPKDAKGQNRGASRL